MYQVTSGHRPEQPTLVMTAKIAVSEIPAFLGKAYSSVAELVGRSGLDFAGRPYTDPNEEPDPRNWRTEIVQT